MRESDTYLAILDEGRDEGRLQELHAGILRLGHIRFGPPEEKTVSAINALKDVDRLRRMHDRLVASELTDWQDLLATP
jgi:hypothetical protein